MFASASFPKFPFSLVPRRFAPAIEREFQQGYGLRVRPTLRIVAILLAVLLALYAARDFADTGSWRYIARYQGSLFALCTGIFAATWVRGFERWWQPALVIGAWVAVALGTGEMARYLMAAPRGPQVEETFILASKKLFFTLQLGVLMACLAAFRLQFVWAALLHGGLALIGLSVFLARFGAGEVVSGGPVVPFGEVRFFWQSILFLGGALLIAAWGQERLARDAFSANRELAILQAQEQQKRVETEKMLHVLNGAIGGIVHDLGNPLTSVQTGAETLRYFVEQDQADPQTVLEFAEIIEGGAKMLGFLRLSLIEQSRVLEGKPVPVELHPVAVRALVQAGAGFQKPRFAAGHTLSIEGPELQICADEMKMVTVMMNLIGNALKYSDGEVCITWCAHETMLLLGILDAGQNGQGLTREQASRLFQAFGRLETHQSIEGTGLGLLSVQKIVEAHGGKTWIEGFESGRPDSPAFSTAQNPYPALLAEPFRTAFVLSCPLATDARGV